MENVERKMSKYKIHWFNFRHFSFRRFLPIPKKELNKPSNSKINYDFIPLLLKFLSMFWIRDHLLII